MKAIKILSIFVLSIGLLFSMNSCVVMAKHDNGKHKGWFKNPKNPHHPKSTNPGKKQVQHPVKSKGPHKK